MFGQKKSATYKVNSYKDHSYIACNSEFVGNIQFVGGLHIEGKVKGNIISSEGSLLVHGNGQVDGDIRVPHMVIDGVVHGDVYASEHVELAAKAVVNGNVYYKSMEMMLGAQINGSLKHSDQPLQLLEHKPAEQNA